jgi:hypothetical protein
MSVLASIGCKERSCDEGELLALCWAVSLTIAFQPCAGKTSRPKLSFGIFVLPGSTKLQTQWCYGMAVDLELVIGADVSYSMDIEDQRIQRLGYVKAFRDPEVIRAVRAAHPSAVSRSPMSSGAASRSRLLHGRLSTASKVPTGLLRSQPGLYRRQQFS